MKQASIRDFRNHLASYSRQNQVVIVTNHGKAVGCFLPLEKSDEVPFELKKEFSAQIGRAIASSLVSKKVSEKDVLNDFKKFKKNRRRQ